jgi:catechol 2,3-dioxygenase-like lactoylglutathione lyase family enzyme
LGHGLRGGQDGLEQVQGAAGLAVSDIDRAREFYEGKLGLSVGID